VKCSSRLSACELPLNRGLALIDAAVPCASLFSQGGDIFDPSFAEALAARVHNLASFWKMESAVAVHAKGRQFWL
jgi:hypothetical protein